MRMIKTVLIQVRAEVEVEAAGYPETAGRLAEMESQSFIREVLESANYRKKSRSVVDAQVLRADYWDADAEDVSKTS